MPEYLEIAPRGIAAGPWLHQLGPETTRSFRALKVWMMVKEHGVDKLGRLIDLNIDQARHLAALVEEHPRLSLVASQTLDIVCFRYDSGGLDETMLKALNVEIMVRMQESGIAVLSDTALGGAHTLRVAICNHRTRYADLDLLANEVVRIGDGLIAQS